MNARLAVEKNDQLVNQLLATARKVSVGRKISVSDAIDFVAKMYIEDSKNDTQACAWEIRADNAKALLNE